MGIDQHARQLQHLLQDLPRNLWGWKGFFHYELGKVPPGWFWKGASSSPLLECQEQHPVHTTFCSLSAREETIGSSKNSFPPFPHFLIFLNHFIHELLHSRGENSNQKNLKKKKTKTNHPCSVVRSKIKNIVPKGLWIILTEAVVRSLSPAVWDNPPCS